MNYFIIFQILFVFLGTFDIRSLINEKICEKNTFKKYTKNIYLLFQKFFLLTNQKLMLINLNNDFFFFTVGLFKFLQKILNPTENKDFNMIEHDDIVIHWFLCFVLLRIDLYKKKNNNSCKYLNF